MYRKGRKIEVFLRFYYVKDENMKILKLASNQDKTVWNSIFGPNPKLIGIYVHIFFLSFDSQLLLNFILSLIFSLSLSLSLSLFATRIYTPLQIEYFERAHIWCPFDLVLCTLASFQSFGYGYLFRSWSTIYDELK